MTNRPDQYPVDYVTSLLLDGKCQNMINIWKKADVHAGDSMILVLRRSKPKQYVLSRHVQAYNLQVCVAHLSLSLSCNLTAVVVCHAGFYDG